ncbi:hypothetical protein KG112_01200 [Nocardioides sp. zg-ZUI104]|uniref:hypothetical protein n=1 Tax=Nocardioides faecalis TaxID=2803858 RepID=UPI001BCD9A5C|nr:hypothetical protein [Nocardioides faecalis]MBS4751420.1 hypothetical protein [Nocardioides faecalis]
MRAAFRRGFGGALVAGAAALAVAPLPMLTAPASAAPTTKTVKFDVCNLGPGSTTNFTYDANVVASAVTDGTSAALTVEFTNKMPSKAPIPMSDKEVVTTLDVTVDGKAVALVGSGKRSAAANEPILLPTPSGAITAPDADVDVVVAKLTVTIPDYGLNIYCTPASASAAIGSVAVDGGVVPTPTAPPTSSSTPTPTPTPTKPESTPTKAQGAKKGVPAKGKASFDCKLMTLGSPFKYNPTVTVSGARAKEGDSKVSISAKFSEIPGLAPVPIENGTMKITAAAKIDGKNVSFSHSSTVNAPTYGTVAVPTLTSTVETDNDQVPVEITAFKFDFGEMSGLTVYSDCKGGGKLSRMTVGVGEKAVNEVGDDVAGGGSAGGGTPAAGGSSLPGTGAGAPLAAIGLWAGALALFGAAVFLLVPRSRIQA